MEYCFDIGGDSLIFVKALVENAFEFRYIPDNGYNGLETVIICSHDQPKVYAFVVEHYDPDCTIEDLVEVHALNPDEQDN
jgi:hypothetical protein